MRENTTTGDRTFRKAYLRRLIDAVDNRVIRIHGAKSTLEQAVIASSQAGKGAAVLYELRAAIANPVNEQPRANVMVNSSPSNRSVRLEFRGKTSVRPGRSTGTVSEL